MTGVASPIVSNAARMGGLGTILTTNIGIMVVGRRCCEKEKEQGRGCDR